MYITSDQYLAYGLDPATPDSWIAAASSLIDAHCKRASLNVTTYTERFRLTEGRHTLRVTNLPLMPLAPATSPLVSLRARLADPRRGEESSVDPLVLDLSRAFGLPGTWSSLDPATIDYDSQTGELTLPANVLGISYNEVEVTCTAGFTTIPDAVKHACAQIVRNAQATPALNVKTGRIDQIRLDYFADSLLDDSVRTILAPYVSTRM